MRKIFFYVVFMVSLTAFRLFAVSPQEIVNKADEAFKTDRIYSISRLTVYRGGKARPFQEIESFSAMKDGRYFSLSIYKSPKRMKGTAVLVIDDDLWVRFASTGRVRKLSSSAKKNSAGGSDFSYSDMGESGSGLADKYNPVLAGSADMEGVLCYEVRLEAKDSDAPYEYLVAYIAKSDYRYIAVDYFEDGANIKTMKLYNYRTVDGFNYPFRIVMESHVRDSRTEIVTEHFERNSSKVNDRYFTVNYLKSIR